MFLNLFCSADRGEPLREVGRPLALAHSPSLPPLYTLPSPQLLCAGGRLHEKGRERSRWQACPQSSSGEGSACGGSRGGLSLQPPGSCPLPPSPLSLLGREQLEHPAMLFPPGSGPHPLTHRRPHKGRPPARPCTHFPPQLLCARGACRKGGGTARAGKHARKAVLGKGVHGGEVCLHCLPALAHPIPSTVAAGKRPAGVPSHLLTLALGYPRPRRSECMRGRGAGGRSVFTARSRSSHGPAMGRRPGVDNLCFKVKQGETKSYAGFWTKWRVLGSKMSWVFSPKHNVN